MNLVRCECKELVDKGICNKGYFFNPSNWDCECDKSCGIGEYLDYSNVQYIKRYMARSLSAKVFSTTCLNTICKGH